MQAIHNAGTNVAQISIFFVILDSFLLPYQRLHSDCIHIYDVTATQVVNMVIIINPKSQKMKIERYYCQRY